MITFISQFIILSCFLFSPSFDRHTLIITAQDRGGNFATKTISFITGYTDVRVVIKPEALNINPGILTAYIKFPAPFGIPITLNATLDGASQERWMVSQEGLLEEELEGPLVIIKFRRQDIEKALTEQGALLDTEFVLIGTFDDGTAPYGQPYEFEGRDSVTKIISDETPSTGPPEQPKGGKK
jgi:hypothetical protein